MTSGCISDPKWPRKYDFIWFVLKVTKTEVWPQMTSGRYIWPLFWSTITTKRSLWPQKGQLDTNVTPKRSVCGHMTLKTHNLILNDLAMSCWPQMTSNDLKTCKISKKLNLHISFWFLSSFFRRLKREIQHRLSILLIFVKILESAAFEIFQTRKRINLFFSHEIFKFASVNYRKFESRF